MKIALKLSLAANAGLAALVLLLSQRPRAGAPDSLHNASAPATSSTEPPPAFNWRLLESGDYRTYIANLRAIGCPRQTIRDIIVADVDGVYATRREQLARQHSGDPAAAGLTSPQALKTGLQHLQSEEAGVIFALLGPPPGSVTAMEADAPPAPASAPPRRSRQDQKVVLPLVFQDPGLDLKLDPTQLGVINDLRESFNQELNGLNLDPASPEYRQRWLNAQREADDMMSAMLGGQFTLNYQMQAGDRTQPIQ